MPLTSVFNDTSLWFLLWRSSITSIMHSKRGVRLERRAFRRAFKICPHIFHLWIECVCIVFCLSWLSLELLRLTLFQPSRFSLSFGRNTCQRLAACIFLSLAEIVHVSHPYLCHSTHTYSYDVVSTKAHLTEGSFYNESLTFLGRLSSFCLWLLLCYMYNKPLALV